MNDFPLDGMFFCLKMNDVQKGVLFMKVKKNTLLLIACLVWCLAGFNILRIGVVTYPPYLTWYNVLLSIVVFALFQLFRLWKTRHQTHETDPRLHSGTPVLFKVFRRQIVFDHGLYDGGRHRDSRLPSFARRIHRRLLHRSGRLPAVGRPVVWMQLRQSRQERRITNARLV